MQIAFIERFKRAGPFIEFKCFLMISEAVVANAEPNAGEESAAIGADKALLLRGSIDGQFKPKNSLIPIFFFHVKKAQVAADFRARGCEVKASEESGYAFISLLEFIVAESECAASADFIFGPTVAEQKVFENGGGCIVQPAVGQLPCEVIFLPLVRHHTVGERMGEDKKVSAAAFIMAAQVSDRNIATLRIGIDTNCFVDGAAPKEVCISAYNPFSEKEGRGITVLIESGVITEQVGIYGTVHSFFEIEKFFLVFFGYNVVGIQPKDIIGGRERKRKVSCRREIKIPWERVNFCTEIQSNIHGVVTGTGIDNNNFIADFFDGLKASAKHFFFVFHDHA